MQVLVERLRAEGAADVWVTSLNQAASEGSLAPYALNVDGPVWQDAPGDPLRARLGAQTYQLWLVDARGRVRFRHDHANLPAEEALLLGELRTLVEER
jgi:hypothetical protein